MQLGLASVPRLLWSGGFSVSLSTERTLSAASASSCGAALHLSPRGLTLKLRVQRHGQKLQLPLYLAALTSAPLLGRWAIAVAALLLGMRKAAVEPRKRRRRARAAAAAAEEREGEARQGVDGRAAAAAEARLMGREAAQRAQAEGQCAPPHPRSRPTRPPLAPSTRTLCPPA